MNSRSPSKQPVTGGAQAIRRAVETLRAVGQLQRSGAKLSRIALATGLSTSTTFRILRSLTEERLLRYDDTERRYYLGSLAFELGLAASGGNHLASRWQPAIDFIARRTRLTTYLMARSDNEVVCLSCIEGSMVLRAMPVDVGQRLPLGVGAGSLAILSSLDDEEIQSILASQSKNLAQLRNPKCTPESVLERVEQARRNGFAMSSGTLAQGISGVGVAISSPDALSALAISVSAVSGEFSLDEAQNLASIISSGIERCRE